MEFSEIFGFLKIISKSIKLVLKNGKSMASITAVCLLLSSFLFSSFIFGFQSALPYLNNDFTTLQSILYLALLLSVESCFLLSYYAITHISGIATILAAAASYSDTKLSPQDLYSLVRTKWRSPFTRYSNVIRRSPRKNTLLFGVVAVAVTVSVGVSILLLVYHLNPITITIASVAGVSLFVFQLYESVVKALAAIIPVVEDDCEAAEAMGRAQKLVREQRIHGFMLNLLLNVMGLIILVSLWMSSGNLLVLGLLFVNTVSLSRILVSLLYTAYYFQCKEYHGHNYFNYEELPLNDIHIP